MNEIAYNQMVAMASKPEAVEKTICYLQKQISTFLRKQDRVLICFENTSGDFGFIMEQAVLRCNAIPVIPEDFRWKTLLKVSFANRCTAIVGAPLLVLGLSKLAQRMQTPLYFRNVILAGYPSAVWMIDGIRKGLDCKIHGCYDPGSGALVAGFSCDNSGSIHLRSEEYGVDIVDDQGCSVPDGELGEVVLYSTDMPELRFATGDFARINRTPCSCGCDSIRVLDFDTVRCVDPDLSKLGEQFHKWTSVLDCRLFKTAYGLELEIVTFPGEKLPKLPSCAKQVIRNWNPETDMPFPHMYVLKNRLFSHNDG